MRLALFAVAGMLVAMSVATPTWAAPPVEAPAGPLDPSQADEATRNAARKIAEEGLALFSAGNYAEALAKFDRAGGMVRAPTMGLMAARSLVKLGRLVEASQRYLAVTQMTLEPGASEAFRNAQTDAAKERSELLPRIPTLWVTLENAQPGAAVTLDGRPLSGAQLGASVPVDPGQHTVVAIFEGTSKTEHVLLQEGEQRRLTLSVGAPRTNGLKVAGIVGLAAGGASLIAFAVTGGLALAQDARFKEKCPSGTCSAGLKGDLASYDSTRFAATGTLVTGVVLAGAGALMIGLAPSPASAPQKVGVQPFIGAGSAGVHVRF